MLKSRQHIPPPWGSQQRVGAAHHPSYTTKQPDKLKHQQDSCAETHSARVMEENTQVRYIIHTQHHSYHLYSLKSHKWNIFNRLRTKCDVCELVSERVAHLAASRTELVRTSATSLMRPTQTQRRGFGVMSNSMPTSTSTDGSRRWSGSPHTQTHLVCSKELWTDV